MYGAGEPTGAVATIRRPVVDVFVLVAFVAIAVVVGVFGILVRTPEVAGWYATAPRPAWALPTTITGPIWFVLYLMMSVAAWLVWRQRIRRSVTNALVLYVSQLVLTSIWPPLFYGLVPALGIVAVWVGVANGVLLAITVVATIREFLRVEPRAAMLFAPYLLWILFLTSINVAIGVLY